MFIFQMFKEPQYFHPLALCMFPVDTWLVVGWYFVLGFFYRRSPYVELYNLHIDKKKKKIEKNIL